MHSQYEARPSCYRARRIPYHQHQSRPRGRTYRSAIIASSRQRAQYSCLVRRNAGVRYRPGFSLPGDVSASSRYWDEDIIEPEVQVTPKGTIQVPTAPGIGYRVRRARVDALTVRSQTFSNSSRASLLTA